MSDSRCEAQFGENPASQHRCVLATPHPEFAHKAETGTAWLPVVESPLTETTFCGDHNVEFSCKDCGNTLRECDCAVMLPDNGPDMYCHVCNPEIHEAAYERAEWIRRFEALERQTDIDTGYDPYND